MSEQSPGSSSAQKDTAGGTTQRREVYLLSIPTKTLNPSQSHCITGKGNITEEQKKELFTRKVTFTLTNPLSEREYTKHTNGRLVRKRSGVIKEEQEEEDGT